MNAAFEWSPFLPYVFAAVLVAGAAVVLLLSVFRGVPEFRWRIVAFFLLAAILMNPLLLHEVRKSLPDKAVIVLDESSSQKIGGRNEVAEKALAHVVQEMEKAGIEPVIVRAGGGGSERGEGTNLFSALRGALPGIPLPQVAGTVLITDGQVHDAPDDPGILGNLAPFNAVLTGKKDEIDRKVTIVSAPKYGLLSQNVTIALRVDDFGYGKARRPSIPLTIRHDGKQLKSVAVFAGEVGEFTFKLEHPGQNVFEFTVPGMKDELTTVNNSAPVIINGVRDRLRVLLVSGAPHMGERAWRNLLKSDPSIDLVHFTILRSMTSVDFTPQNELSLIVFPVQDLFQRKLKDFDLVIFDRYRQASLLTQLYFLNIASYVKQGGAFLMAMGSDRMDDEIFKTPLASVLPVSPIGEEALTGAYIPKLTKSGETHPITGELQAMYAQKPWGSWFTQAGVDKHSGDTLMNGKGEAPLLVIDKVSDGRVAVLTSDNVWLWSKGGDMHGPYTRLLRNTAHWLMKEPELEDDYIKAVAKGMTIRVAQRNLSIAPRTVTMADPSGKQQPVTLNQKTDDGWIGAEVDATENGIYSFASGEKKAFVVVGTAANEEFSDVHTTEERLKPVVGHSDGEILWFQEEPSFGLNSLRFQRKTAYAIQSVESRELIPNVLAILAILFAMLFVWWRESGAK